MMIAIISTAFVRCRGGPPSGERPGERASFKRIIIDDNGPPDPWGKAFGDMDGDGFPDLIVGGHGFEKKDLLGRVLVKIGIRKNREPVGELVLYRSPAWERQRISDSGLFSTDHEVADVDADGRPDVVSLTSSELLWFRNPEWTPFVIDSRGLHDIELSDFDGDGDIDIVARNQSGFRHNDGDRLHFYRQDSPTRWDHFSIMIPHGEGLKIADMNGDGRSDVVVNRFWLENPGVLAEDAPWERREYGRAWDWPDVFVDVADMNEDGRPDIILAPAEPAGERYRISWFEAPASESGAWREHVVDQDVEAVHHFIGARDMDLDGLIDIVTAEMHQGEDPDEIAVYWRRNGDPVWEKEVLASSGSHNMRIVDIDKDGDLDLFGANWSGGYQAIELWENRTGPKPLAGWKRHVIDDARPWRSVFIMAADLDRDGLLDVLTGGWWYRNPGRPEGKWERRPFGGGAGNVAIVEDFDRDGNPDILASQWKDERRLRFHERVLRKLRLRSYPVPPQGGFVWGRNNGHGDFEIMGNIMAGDGDFLQGAVTVVDPGGDLIALSWHEAGRGVQALSVPLDPVHESWARRRISKDSQDEQLSAGDIDADGDLDIMQGTRWLRNEGNGGWTPFVLHAGEAGPDRNRLMDMNGDGKLDVVVGFEAISVIGKVAWYEQRANPTGPWAEHPIALAVGPMSLDVADFDGDGDPDVIVGEHHLAASGEARLLAFENVDGSGREWSTHVIHTGDEHHDGAVCVDIDNDGDLDIISIGWGHDQVLLYENPGQRDRTGGRTSAASRRRTAPAGARPTALRGPG